MPTPLPLLTFGLGTWHLVLRQLETYGNYSVAEIKELESILA